MAKSKAKAAKKSADYSDRSDSEADKIEEFEREQARKAAEPEPVSKPRAPYLLEVNHFASPSYQWWMSVPATLILLYISYATPETFDSPSLLRICKDYHEVFKWINFIIWGSHVVEMFVAVYLCRQKGIMNATVIRLWTLQTLIMGYLSIQLLLVYQPRIVDPAIIQAKEQAESAEAKKTK